MKINFWVCTLIASVIFLSGCTATESHRRVTVEKVESAYQHYSGHKAFISIGKFDNRSNFGKGIFSDGEDRLGSQAKTALISHLQQTNRFRILDRNNMTETKQESNIKNKKQQLKGADYIITGDITEFGRKEVGDKQLFGLLGKGKQQIAYAKVNLNVVNVHTSEVVYATQGAGEYELSNREFIGFGSSASYDSTLNGKVLDLAMREAINSLIHGIDSGIWQPTQE